MESRQINDLRNLSLRNQLRFLIYLYGMKIKKRYRYSRARARVHWIGHQYRSRRPERIFIAFVLLGAFFVLDAEQVAIWAAGWGGLVSLFVIVRSVSMVWQR